MSEIKVNPVPGSIGVEILDVDLSLELSERVFSNIRNIFFVKIQTE